VNTPTTHSNPRTALACGIHPLLLQIPPGYCVSLEDALLGHFPSAEAYAQAKTALARREGPRLSQHVRQRVGLGAEQAGILERILGSNDLVDVNYMSKGSTAAATVRPCMQCSTRGFGRVVVHTQRHKEGSIKAGDAKKPSSDPPSLWRLCQKQPVGIAGSVPVPCLPAGSCSAGLCLGGRDSGRLRHRAVCKAKRVHLPAAACTAGGKGGRE
jgi:hypothetical protein